MNQWREICLQTIQQLTGHLSLQQSLDLIGIHKMEYYRLIKNNKPKPKIKNDVAKNKKFKVFYDADLEKQILAQLNSERFIDNSPYQIFYTLLDEGKYLCSIRTMYRILSKNGQVLERRKQVRSGKYAKPELMATAPNQVWSWDITKLKTMTRGAHFQLYVILDIFSRNVTGWFVAERECQYLARAFIDEAIKRQGISLDPANLTIHSDRGGSMMSGTVYDLYVKLGITRSLNRPHVSNDNPFSESHFRTLKYHSLFPERFESLEHVKVFCTKFFNDYNQRHKHSGIAFYSPDDLHTGKAHQIHQVRQSTLDEAYAARPDRFRRGAPKAKLPPITAYINPPQPAQVIPAQGTQIISKGGSTIY